MYLASPLMFAVLQRWPEFRRKSLLYGLLTVACALVLSSFATTVWHLLLTQGLLYALGGGFLYYPIFFFIDEWFIRRKGFAYGVMWAGSGCGGLAGPLVMNWGLARYGHQVFLRGWAVAIVSIPRNRYHGAERSYTSQLVSPNRTAPILCSPPCPRIPHQPTPDHLLRFHQNTHLLDPPTRKHRPRPRLLHPSPLPPL
jgi:MFS family permease